MKRLQREQGAVVQQIRELAAQQVTPASLEGKSLNGMVNNYLALVESAGKLDAFKDAEFVALLQLMAAYGR